MEEDDAGMEFGAGLSGAGMEFGAGLSGATEGPGGAGGGKMARVMVDTFLPREEDVIRFVDFSSDE